MVNSHTAHVGQVEKGRQTLYRKSMAKGIAEFLAGGEGDEGSPPIDAMDSVFFTS